VTVAARGYDCSCAAIAPCVRHLLAAQDMCDSVAANMQQQDSKVDLCI